MRHRPAEAAPGSHSSGNSADGRPLRRSSLAKAVAAAKKVNCHDVTKSKVRPGRDAQPRAASTLKRERPMDEVLCPGRRTSLRRKEKGHGVHGQHEGSSRVIHLSRGRRPKDYNVVRASDGRSVIRCGTRSAPALKQRTNRRCRGPSHAFSRRAASRPPTKT